MRLLPVVVALAAVLLSLRLSSSSSPRLSSAVSYSVSPALPAPLPKDDRLTRMMERHFLDQGIEAPEHFAFDHAGDIFFGVADGRIMRTRADAVTGALSEPQLVVYTGDPSLVDRLHPCGSEESEAICGRPLGMAFDAAGLLLVADAYLGLLEIDPAAKSKRVLLREVDGRPLYFANSVVVGPKTELVYFTDSSSRWRRREFIYEVLEAAPTGGLIAFDRVRKEARVLAHNLAFPNGILVDPRAEKFLLFNELNRARILRFDLAKQPASKALPAVDAAAVLPTDGRPAAQDASSSALSILLDNLPGIPDNLAWESAAASGSVSSGPAYFWVGCGTKRTQPFSLTDFLAGWPSVRATLAALVPKEFFLKLVPRIGLLLRVEVADVTTGREARIAEALQDPAGARSALLTGAYEHRGYLYIGSISHDVKFVGRIPWGAANRTDTTHRWN